MGEELETKKTTARSSSKVYGLYDKGGKWLGTTAARELALDGRREHGYVVRSMTRKQFEEINNRLLSHRDLGRRFKKHSELLK